MEIFGGFWAPSPKMHENRRKLSQIDANRRKSTKIDEIRRKSSKIVNLWAAAPGPGPLGRGPWAGVSGPGSLGRGLWAGAPGPRPLGRSSWAEAPGPRQGDGGYGDCVKRCPKWSHELSRKGAEFRDSSKAIFAPSSRIFQGSIFQKKTCMECTGSFQYKKTYCIRKKTCMECTGLL